MKFPTLSVALVSCLAGSAAARDLNQYISDIPDCSLSTFRDKFLDKGCKRNNIDSETFDCMCIHMISISAKVGKEESRSCSKDFSDAIGGACGIWLSKRKDSDGYTQARDALASKLSSSSSSSNSTSGDSDDKDNDKKDSAASAASPIAGLVGVAAIAALLLV